MLDGFLLGIIVACSSVAAGFFFRFWRQTRDPLFIYFGASFLIQAINRTWVLVLDEPNQGNALLYSVRLLSYLLILIGFFHKNIVRARR